MPRVLITPHLVYELDVPCRRALLEAGLEVVYPPGAMSLMDPKVLLEHLDGVSAVLAGMEPFNREVLEASNLRVIARAGVGYDAVDMAAATERGVVVTITPGTNEVSVAEQTLALMLGVMRGFPERDREVRCGIWKRVPLPRLAGKILGLVGLGRTGRAVATRAQALGMTVIGSDPVADPAFVAQYGIRLVTVDELLAEADIVSLHAPATPQTIRLIDSRALAKMKPGSVLINTARGSLVDEAALCEALRSRHLMAAGLDVFDVEPLPTDSPLLELDNVLLAPHMGGLDHDSVEAMTTMAAQSIAELYQGGWPGQGRIVNEDLRAGWKW
jgi:phosphoglycerate dehydrogenase-like enzyme